MFESYYRPSLNTSFSPASAPAEGVSETEHINKGLYAYINAADNSELQKTSDEIFGRTAPFTNSEADATLIGRRIASSTGYRSEPIRYIRDNKLAMPENWSGENAQLYTLIGQNYIAKAQEHYNNAKAAHKQKLAEAQKDYTETMGALPQLIADSIRSEGGNKGTPLTPEYLEKLTKYGAKEGAIASQNRAALAWMYMSAYMDDPELLQTGLGLREKLLDIANVLSDEKGEIDPAAQASLVIMARQKAIEKQTKIPDSLNHLAQTFLHHLSSALEADQDTDMASGLGRTLAYQEIIKRRIIDSPVELNAEEIHQAEEEASKFAADLYSDKVSSLLSVFREAVDLEHDTPESASFVTKQLAFAAGAAGSTVLPILGDIAGTVMARGAGAGKIMQRVAGWAGAAYASYDSNLSRAYADAVRDGKINPSIHASIQAAAQSVSEGAFTVTGTMPALSKIAGKATNYISSRAAANILARNTAIGTAFNYLGGVILEGTGEMLEEELSNALETSLNKLARIAGVELTPVQYKMGEALGNMKPHEIMGFFTYAAILGAGSIPSAYASARNFALNSDNLLNAGHSKKAVRDIQFHILQAQDKAADIYSDPKLTKEQKQEQVDKLWESVNQYQKDKAQTDIYDADPEIVRQRLKEQKKKTLSKAELALAIQGEIDLRIAKDAGIIDATAQPGDKFTVTLIEKGGTNADGSKAPDKLVQQEWTRNQLVNYFQIQHSKIYTNALRGFQGLVQAHAAAQTITDIDGLKVQLQELREIPYEAYASLKKHQGITTEYIAELISLVRADIARYESAGMTRAEAEAQPSNFLPGLSLGELLTLQGAAEERRDSAADTTEGKAKGITKGQSIEYGAFNITRADGSILIAYVAGRADVNDILEDLIEAHIKHTVATTGLTYTQLGNTIKEIEKHLPPVTMPDGKVEKLTLLPAGKTEYTQQNIIEAYSKLALANYLYNEQYLPLTQGGHRLLREIGRVVDTARLYKAIGDAWFTYANSEQGKAHLANGGQTFADLLTNAGFKIGSLVANARANAEQTLKVIEGRDFQPDPAQEVKALINRAEAEQQLADLNAKQAAEPTIIPAAESITGKEITIEPESSEQETLVSLEPDPGADLSGEKATTILSHMRDLIAKGKARAEHFAIVFREIPGLTEAQAIEQGIRPLTQRGEPTAAYTQGKHLAERCTDVQYLLLREGKLTQKAKRDILLNPQPDGNVVAFSIKPQQKALREEYREERQRAGKMNRDFAKKVESVVTKRIQKDGRKKWALTVKPKFILEVCPYPAILNTLKPWNGNIVMTAEVAKKLLNLHDFTIHDMSEIPGELVDPVAVFADDDPSKIHVVTTIKTPNAKGEIKSAKVVLQLKKTKKGIEIIDVKSAFSSDQTDIYAHALTRHKLLYADKERAMEWADSEGKSIALLLQTELAVHGSAIILKEDLENVNAENQITATAAFSIKAAQPTADRFKASPLGHNMLYFIRNEARRYARIFGDKTPHEQAVNAAQSAAAIIAGVDKYLQRTGTESKPVPQGIRRRLQHLQKVAEKYAQIIATGRTRSFKKLAPQEQAELQAAIADLQQQEQEAAITDADKLLTDSDRLTKKERTARQKEHDRTILREAAKGRVYATLAAMLEAAADALDTHLKNEILVDINRITAPVKIKRTASGGLKGKMTAPIYRKLEQAIQFMALSPRALETAVDDVFTAQETLARAINEGYNNLTSGNTLLIQLADQLSQGGIKVTPQTLTAALTDYSNALAIYGDIESKNYEQTRLAANALFHLIQYGRNKWADRQAQREAEIQQYLQHFLANTTAESGRANAKNKATADEAKKILNGSVLDKFMNSTQLFTALASYEPLRPLFEHLRYQLSLSLDTRQKHLNEIREQELAAFGQIIGIKPETAAGYTSKQLQQLSDKFDAFYAENNTTHNTGITVTWQAENKDGELETYSEELEYTNWELLDLLLMYRQEHYQANAELHGFTPEILTQIEKHIGQQLMDYGNAIQQIIIADGTIPVYEEREGIPMRHNPLYWPGSVNINTLNTTREEPLVNPYHPAGSYDFIKSRVRNLKELRPQNAYAKYRSAIAQRANYIYLDPVTAPLRSLLARDQFANRLTALIGPGLTNQLKTTINEIVGAGHNETSLQDIGGNNKFGNALSHATLAALAGNINSIVRQASAVANAGLMPGISPVDYYKYAILVRDNNTNIGITDVLKLDCFAIRRRDNAYVNELAAMGANAKYSTLLNWTKAGMNLMDKADVLANAVSAAIVYNHKYDQLKATGRYTEEQLRARAEAEVSQYLRLAAQPLNRVDKSALYWQLSQSALGRSILYMGSESINKLGMLRLNYIINRNNGTGAAKNTGMLLAKMGLTVGLVSAAINALIDLLAGNTPDDDDNLAAWAMYQWLWGTIGQHTDAMPVLGSFTNAWLSPYARFGDSGVTIPGKNIYTRTSKLYTMLTDNKTYSAEQWNKAITNFMRETSAISGYLGGTYAPWQWYSTVSSVLSSLTTVANTVNVLLPAANTITEWGTGEQTKDRSTKRRRRLKSKAETVLENTIETTIQTILE